VASFEHGIREKGLIKMSIKSSVELKSVASPMEEQLEHPRFSIPFRLNIAGRRHEGVEISLGGLTSAGLMDRSGGSLRDAVIEFPFSGFSLDLPVKLNLLESSTDNGIAKFSFQEPMGNHRVALQSIISAYIAGEMTHIPGLLGLPASSKAKSHQLVPKSNPFLGIVSATCRGLLLAAAGVALAAFIADRIHTRLFLYTPTATATIAANTTSLPARKTGAVVTLNKDAAFGQPLFSVLGDDGILATANMPCDCVVAQIFVLKGGVAVAGSPVLSIMPRNSETYVSAFVKPELLSTLQKNSTVTVSFADGTSLAAAIFAIPPVGAGRNIGSEKLEVLLKTTTGLPVSRIGEKAMVTIDTSPGWLRNIFSLAIALWSKV
jgi:mannuronan synthase